MDQCIDLTLSSDDEAPLLSQPGGSRPLSSRPKAPAEAHTSQPRSKPAAAAGPAASKASLRTTTKSSGQHAAASTQLPKFEFNQTSAPAAVKSPNRDAEWDEIDAFIAARTGQAASKPADAVPKVQSRAQAANSSGHSLGFKSRLSQQLGSQGTGSPEPCVDAYRGNLASEGDLPIFEDIDAQTTGRAGTSGALLLCISLDVEVHH